MSKYIIKIILLKQINKLAQHLLICYKYLLVMKISKFNKKKDKKDNAGQI